MKPHVICHMISSLDGGLHLNRCSKSPDGDRASWSAAYEQIHEQLDGDAWIVGRVTMAEISKASAHPPAHPVAADRQCHIADRDAGSYAIALDPSGKLHFEGSRIGDDHVVVLLGPDVPDAHLAELAADGVSYLVSDAQEIDLGAMLLRLAEEFGIRRVLIEGGAGICGSFFAAGLVDELSLLLAPALDGRANHQSFVEFGEAGLASKTQLSLTGCEALPHGLVHLRYAVTPQA